MPLGPASLFSFRNAFYLIMPFPPVALIVSIVWVAVLAVPDYFINRTKKVTKGLVQEYR